MKEQILEKLKSVKYPGFDKDIVSFNFVKDIKTENENVIVELEIVSSNPQ
ncbi:iron-sulfur cluster assembly protein, partial [Campylobacter coli]